MNLFKIRAEITIKLRGGRTLPIVNGYRPGFCFIENKQTSGSIQLLGEESLEPGKTGLVYIAFFSDELLGAIQSGTKFSFYEGKTEIGTGEVIDILGWVPAGT